VLEDGIPKARKVLEDNALPLTDENIFIAATCGDKGITFLKGDAKLTSITKKERKNQSLPKQRLPQHLLRLPDRVNFLSMSMDRRIMLHQSGTINFPLISPLSIPPQAEKVNPFPPACRRLKGNNKKNV
jgi:hypothetical protein